MPREAACNIGLRQAASKNSGFAGLLSVTANNLDFVRGDNDARSVHFESDVSDEEGPNLIAKSVGIKTALFIGETAT